MPDEAKVQSAALEAAVLDNTGASSVQAAALEVAVNSNIGASQVQAAALEVAVNSNIGASLIQGAALEVAVLTPYEGPVAILHGTTGVVGSDTTFNGAASSGDTFRWTWTSVPGGSSFANAPTLFPDNGATSPVNMTDNQLLVHLDGNLNDASGNGRNGTASGGVTQVAGKVGAYAAELDTTGQIAFTTDFQYTNEDFSVAFWIKPGATQPNAWATVVSVYGAVTSGWYFLQESTITNRYFFVGNNGSSWQGNNSRVNLTANVWSHIVVVRTGSRVRLYLNGSLFYDDPNDCAAVIGYNGASPRFVIGGNDEGAGSRWNGAIDELAIFSRVLSDAEIAAIYDIQNNAYAQPLSLVSTQTFTPDVAGTYSIQLAASKPAYATDTVTANAVISAPSPPSTGIGNMTGAALSQRSLSGTHFLIPLTGIDPSEDLD